ncbi:rhomboid family intramembrane serine protease [Gellertiella hungarica]|uniref:Membrane associated rhomboid family serine protease n=1 Tax=Gellertiella hungarica TaxID=1572859 RepID=A0A7W6J5E1_9HYPH|nr:rhomboid family intramembrane serine protease [Gellertiella hungarica]MBB4065111.1 membrane associated rhomboid family serine protease [Gellertiella hungarica]
MLIPLHDANALRHIRTPVVTRLLILANIAVYLLMLPDGLAALADRLVLLFGFIPALVTHAAVLPPDLQLVPPEITFVTYAFLHGSISHIGINMIFLYIFGDNVEDAMGHGKFLFFYLACAAAGAGLHLILTGQPEAPLIGASGAISGVVIAYALLHPHVRLWVLVLFGIPVPLPAFIPLVFWIGQQFFELVTGLGDSVSFAAHVGGIVAGGLLVLVLRRPGVPLFDRDIARSRAAADEPVPVQPWRRIQNDKKGPSSDDSPPPATRWGR